MMINGELLNSEHKAEIQAKIQVITNKIAVLKEQQELLKEEFKKKDGEYFNQVMILIKERSKLVNERKYGR